MTKFFASSSKVLEKYNNNAYLVGLAIILLNIGSKYLILDLSKGLQQLMKLKIMRRIVIFSLLFAYTRDLVASLVMTAVFILLTSGIFNEKSIFSILPKNFKYDPDPDTITEEEYMEAKETVKKYELIHIKA